MTLRIGIYPGTFDPVHKGHITFCMEAAQRCGLEKVVLLPEQLPREKQGVTAFDQRAKQLEAAVQPFAQLEVLRLEEVQFTVGETLPQLAQLFPDSELTLLLGSDVVKTFSYRWSGLEILLQQMPLAIGLRGGDTPQEMATVMAALEADYGLSTHYTMITTLQAHMTSSQVRTGECDAGLRELAVETR